MKGLRESLTCWPWVRKGSFCVREVLLNKPISHNWWWIKHWCFQWIILVILLQCNCLLQFPGSWHSCRCQLTAGHCMLPHNNNRSGIAQGMWRRASSLDWTSKYHRSKSDKATWDVRLQPRGYLLYVRGIYASKIIQMDTRTQDVPLEHCTQTVINDIHFIWLISAYLPLI